MQVEKEIPDWFARLAKRTGAFVIIDRKHTPNADFDWELELRPTQAKASIKVLIEAKQRVSPQEFLGFINQLDRTALTKPLVLCSTSISPRVAELCREVGVGYLDAAGNCHIQAPGLFIHIEGQPNPHPSRRDAADPFATKSSRITRVLLSDVKREWQVQELAHEADVSLGLTSRVKRALLDEALIELRDGLLSVREPASLLDAWRNAYELPQRHSFYVMGKNKDVEERIAAWSVEQSCRYVLTAYSGAWRLAPMVRHNMSTVYVELSHESDLDSLIAELDAKAVDSGANLSIWLPRDEYVFYGTRETKGLTLVSALQLYLDLSQLAGRGLEAAQEVFENELQARWQT